MSSTGDGVLAVFQEREVGTAHVLRAYLACLQLLESLPPLFATLGGARSTSTRPRFGIGMESGTVTPLGPEGGLRTVLGHCINIAARLEALTKTVAGTSLVMRSPAGSKVATVTGESATVGRRHP